MSSGLYVRGNGAKALQKRFSVFKSIVKYAPFAVLTVLYVVLQGQIKTVCRSSEDLTNHKNLLVEELERLTSDYDKMINYGEIKEFAQNELAMVHSAKYIKSFAVIDKNEIFKSEKTTDLPQLFETNIDLASIEPEESSTIVKE